MRRDSVVEEVRKIREAHARKFNYDLHAIYRDIKEREKTSGRNFIGFAPKRAENAGQPK